MANLDAEVFTLLLDACRDGDLERVKRYLSKDNIEGTESYTPLMAAISFTKYNVLEYLLSQGANPNIIINGDTGEYRYQNKPILHTYYLHYAIEKEIEKYFFKNSDKSDEYISKNIPTRSIEILIKYGSEINILDEKGNTPLDIAICSYNKTAEVLLRSLGGKTVEEIYGNEIYIKNKEKYDILITACINGDIKLIKDNINEDIINGFNKIPMSNPLMMAIHYQNYQIVDLLLNLGANPNIKFNGGGVGKNLQTNRYKILNDTYAIHCAVEQEALRHSIMNLSGHPSIKALEILMNYRAEINLHNEAGETPLDIALFRDNKSAISYLKSLGGKTSKELRQKNK